MESYLVTWFIKELKEDIQKTPGYRSIMEDGFFGTHVC